MTETTEKAKTAAPKKSKRKKIILAVVVILLLAAVAAVVKAAYFPYLPVSPNRVVKAAAKQGITLTDTTESDRAAYPDLQESVGCDEDGFYLRFYDFENSDGTFPVYKNFSTYFYKRINAYNDPNLTLQSRSISGGNDRYALSYNPLPDGFTVIASVRHTCLVAEISYENEDAFRAMLQDIGYDIENIV